MRLLAIESSAAELSLALFDGLELRLERAQPALMRQNESLAPLVVAALAEAGWKPGELGLIAISLGPGSFTGLRTGLAFAKGLSYATGAKLVGIPTLDAWALQSGLNELEVWIDARKGMVYRGRYSNGRAAEPALMLPRESAEKERPAGTATVGLEGQLKAEFVGRLALKRFAAGQVDDPLLLEPLYLRRSEAELLWEKRNGA